MKRTLKAVETKAFKMGIYREILLWSPEEYDLLRKYYPLEGGAVYKRFNDKYTADQCRSCAHRLGLKSPIISWTVEEEILLREYYTLEGGLTYKRFGGKFTKHQCMQHAQLLGLKATTNSADRWSAEEDNIIKQYYPTEGKECYKRIPGTTATTVLGRASALGIRYLNYRNKPRKIKCIETNMLFDNISKAANYYKLAAAGFTRYINGVCEYWGKLPDGTKLHWKYVE